MKSRDHYRTLGVTAAATPDEIKKAFRSKVAAAHPDKGGQRPLVLHFGDHDPSGKDMTRDIQDRLNLFTGDEIEIRRLALNMDQIQEHNPPPNPAKITDSRAAKYIEEFGDESWELDALAPDLISRLVETEILSVRNNRVWAQDTERHAGERKQLQALSTQWDEVSKHIEL